MAATDAENTYLEKRFEEATAYFREERKSILNGIFLISSGTFTISIGLLSTFSDAPVVAPWLLIAAWFFLGLCIVCHLTSSYLKAMSESEVMDELESKKLSQAPLPLGYNPGFVKKVQWYVKGSTYLLRATYIFFGVGIIFLFIFASLNFLTKQATQGEFDDLYHDFLNYKNEHSNSPKFPNTGFPPR